MAPKDSASAMEAGTANYGSAPKLAKKMPQKEPLNVALVFGCVVVPLVIFVITYYIMSSSLRYHASFVAYGVAIIMLLIGFGLGAASGGKRWLGLLSLLSLIAWGWAFFASNDNFAINIEPFHDLQQLTVYKDVNPSKDQGNQFMDYGVLGFVEKAEIDQDLSMAFKNRNTYCVAPVKVHGAKSERYDFWAAGINCCSPHYHDFQCGGWNDHYARSGVRVMRETHRAFYQLAANQAAAAYNISVGPNAVFFEWAADPEVSIRNLQDDGTRNLIGSSFTFLGVDVAVVLVALIVFSSW